MDWIENIETILRNWRSIHSYIGYILFSAIQLKGWVSTGGLTSADVGMASICPTKINLIFYPTILWIEITSEVSNTKNSLSL